MQKCGPAACNEIALAFDRKMVQATASAIPSASTSESGLKCMESQSEMIATRAWASIVRVTSDGACRAGTMELGLSMIKGHADALNAGLGDPSHEKICRRKAIGACGQ